MARKARPKRALSIPMTDGGTSGWAYWFGQNDHRIEMTYRDLDGPWIYGVEGRTTEKGPIITTLTIAQRDVDNPVPITRQHLRSAPLGVLFERVRRALRADWQKRVQYLLKGVRFQVEKSGRSYPPEHYIQVAWVYNYAIATGVAPRQAVVSEWDISAVTASRWIAEARRRGYLSKYKPGVRLGKAKASPSYDSKNSEKATEMVNEAIYSRVIERNPDKLVGAFFDVLEALMQSSDQRIAQAAHSFESELSNYRDRVRSVDSHQE